MSSNPFDLALILAALRYLADKEIGTRQAQVAEEALAVMPPTTRLPVSIDGKTVATVSVPAPAKRAKITHPAKFLAWVQENRPGEVYDVPTVRESFEKAVKDSVRDRGGWLDTATGEIVPVPGVEQLTGDPYVRVELDATAGDAIGQAWREGRISLRDVLALPSGGDGDD